MGVINRTVIADCMSTHLLYTEPPICLWQLLCNLLGIQAERKGPSSRTTKTSLKCANSECTRLTFGYSRTTLSKQLEGNLPSWYSCVSRLSLRGPRVGLAIPSRSSAQTKRRTCTSSPSLNQRQGCAVINRQLAPVQVSTKSSVVGGLYRRIVHLRQPHKLGWQGLPDQCQQPGGTCCWRRAVW